MNSSIKLFGKRIKELRKKQGITQEQLAEILGVENQTISRIETGCFFTSYENLEKLAFALNTDIKDFFEFNHLKDKEELKKDLIENINNLSTSDLQKISKFIKEFL